MTRLYYLFCTILFLFWLSTAWTQTPFDCNGKIYRVLEEQGGTTFQGVDIDKTTQEATFKKLHFFPSTRINGIAYRPEDNLIYGVLLETPYVLCRIDANYQLERLAELPLPTSLLFVSGDVSPDERYLVLLGFGPNEEGNLIALVDLESPTYETQIFPAAKTDNSTLVQCADIAFHPTSNKLFGFEHSEGRLITIDIENRTIDNSTFPTTEVLKGNVPTIFFDAYGQLYGVGSGEGTYSNRSLYKFNVENGKAEEFQQMGFERNQDGCSCPFKVELLNRVSQRLNFPCTRLEFEFTLINRTDKVQTDVTFSDTLPLGANIIQISELPFAGTIVNGLDGSILTIKNIELPIGVFRFQVTVELEPDVQLGTIQNRAYLDGVLLTSLTETERIISDDPQTDVPDDPTLFYIEKLAVDFDNIAPNLCPNDTLWLSAGIEFAESYAWNTGATTAEIPVTQAGMYAVTVSTACGQTDGHIFVNEENIAVDLGEDLVLERGESIELQPSIRSDAPVQTFFWQETLENSLSCQTCEIPMATPTKNAEYRLEIQNEVGCRATDALQIRLQDFALYAPNAFSPNADGENDVFYLQSRTDYQFNTFQIYDRWGGMLYSVEEGSTNAEEFGWDGQSQGKAAQPGVYVWVSELVSLDGQKQVVSGEVNLFR